MIPIPARVRRVRRETRDSVTLCLSAPRGFRFAPGQFDMLWLPGAGEVAISVAGQGEGTVEHTVRAVGEVTRAIAALRPGDVLGLRGPFGAGWPLEAVTGLDLLVVAGGVGLAPLRPLVLELLRRPGGARRAALLYGARTPDELLYRRELPAWERRGLGVRTTVDRRQPGWSGRVGLVTGLFEDLRLHPGDTAAFLCGPEAMMRFGVRDLLRLGLPPERIWVSLERSMKCGVGRCGHCQCGPLFVCRDGPVLRWDRVAPLLEVREA
ncbi:MAG TPA: FAD/NAD(P)-binding protein [Anaeromyxobacteraceae bacterium]|nr:FAD/NAD(P)-binding protein [Anaeromyxobacteraceae bacterium]